MFAKQDPSEGYSWKDDIDSACQESMSSYSAFGWMSASTPGFGVNHLAHPFDGIFNLIPWDDNIPPRAELSP